MSTEDTYDKRIEDIVDNIGIVAYLFGKRPSELFEWNSPDEWLERLMFDMEIGVSTWKLVADMKQFP